MQTYRNDLAPAAPPGVVPGRGVREERSDELVEEGDRVADGLVVERDERVGGPGRVREEAGDEQLEQRPAAVAHPDDGERAVGSRKDWRDPLEPRNDCVARGKVVEGERERRCDY